jgi:hypothetical protein
MQPPPSRSRSQAPSTRLLVHCHMWGLAADELTRQLNEDGTSTTSCDDSTMTLALSIYSELEESSEGGGRT